MMEPFSDCHGAPASLLAVRGHGKSIYKCSYCLEQCSATYKTVGIAEPVPAKKKRDNKKKV